MRETLRYGRIVTLPDSLTTGNSMKNKYRIMPPQLPERLL